jgi:hypothetical protein
MGVKLTKETMKIYEEKIERLENFVSSLRPVADTTPGFRKVRRSMDG